MIAAASMASAMTLSIPVMIAGTMAVAVVLLANAAVAAEGDFIRGQTLSQFCKADCRISDKADFDICCAQAAYRPPAHSGTDYPADSHTEKLVHRGAAMSPHLLLSRPVLQLIFLFPENGEERELNRNGRKYGCLPNLESQVLLSSYFPPEPRHIAVSEYQIDLLLILRNRDYPVAALCVFPAPIRPPGRPPPFLWQI
jgi:hypothetical protein